MKLHINSMESFRYAVGKLRDLQKEHRYIKLSVTIGKDRSREQNALAWTWYKQIADERGEDSTEDVHTFCKAHFGIPILRAADEAFNDEYERLLLCKEPGKRVPYAARLFVIRQIPVTSRFTVKQMSEYLQEVQRHYASLEADPVDLRFPDDWD